jgi:hypothetical protein
VSGVGVTRLGVTLRSKHKIDVSVQLERAIRPLFLKSLSKTMSAGRLSIGSTARAFFTILTNANGPAGKLYTYDGAELKKRTLGKSMMAKPTFVRQQR